MRRQGSGNPVIHTVAAEVTIEFGKLPYGFVLVYGYRCSQQQTTRDMLAPESMKIYNWSHPYLVHLYQLRTGLCNGPTLCPTSQGCLRRVVPNIVPLTRLRYLVRQRKALLTLYRHSSRVSPCNRCSFFCERNYDVRARDPTKLGCLYHVHYHYLRATVGYIYVVRIRQAKDQVQVLAGISYDSLS